MIFKKSEIPFRHSLPSTRIIVLGAGALVLAGCSGLIGWAAGKVAEVEYLTFVAPVAHLFVRCMLICLAIAVLAVIAGIVIYILTPERWKIAVKVKKALLTYEYGNPLGLQEGQRMPRIRCKDKWEGCYVVIVSAVSCTVEQLAKVSTCISSALNRKHSIYAVTQTDVDVACNNVRYLVENVAVDKSLHVQSVTDLKKEEPMKLIVQEGTYIDLSTSGHMLVAGKTRSGKTTGIISLLLQVLQDGRDKHGSEVMIIDPKQAELSQLPHTYTLDEDGEARAILEDRKSVV